MVDSVNTRLLAVGEMTGAVAVTAGGSWGLGSYPITLPIAPVEIGATAWNPADVSSGLTLSGGNLTTATTATAAFEATRSVDAVTANQKIYFEIVVNSIVSGDALRFGVTNSTASPPNTIPNGDFAALTYSPGAGYAGFDDTTSPDHGTPVFIGTAVTNDVIGIAYDSANQTFWGRLNSGIWNNSGSADPATNTGGFAVVMGGAGSIKALAELISESGSTVQATTRFASSDWTLGAPSSFTEIAS